MPKRFAIRAAALALALLSTRAVAQERPSEEDLFGKPEEQPAPKQAPQTAPAQPAPQTAAPAKPAAETPAQAGPAPALRPNENPLAIGGVAYLRGTSTWRKGAPPSQWALLSPNLFDLYADVRPNDRVRGFALGRLFFDPTQSASRFAANSAGDVSGGGANPFGSLATSGGTNAVLDQLWLNFDVKRTVFITAGKQHVKWGVGHFWNPTDYLHPLKRDPLAVYDTRTGVTMVKAHLPWEARGWNLYGVGLLEDAAGQNTIGTLGRTGAGARGEMVLGSAELGADALVQRGNRPRFGVDVSAGVWQLDLYAEAALRSGADVARFVRDPSAFQGWEPVRATGFTPQITAGGSWSWKYSDEDSLTVGAEYFYNDAGYSDPHVYSALLAAQVLPEVYPFEGGTLPPATYFNAFYLGRHYGAVFVNVPKPGSWNDWDFTLSALGNLSDKTFIVRLDTGVVVNTYLRLEAFIAGHAGPEGGEFRLAFGAQAIQAKDQTGAPIGDPIPIPALHAPIVDLGIALRVNL